MGYYSDVAIAISKRDSLELIRRATERPDGDIVKWLLLERMDQHNLDDIDPSPDGVYILRWYGIKWYEEFSEVKYVMDFIRALGEGNYEYVRIGEEDTDVEHEGDIGGDQCLYLERTICFDPSQLPLHGDY